MSNNMTATYEDPLSSQKDKIRLEIGDVDMDKPLLYDEEIESILAMYEGARAYAVLYRTMAGRLAKLGKRDFGPQSEDFTETIKMYNDLAKKYEQAASQPIIGGGNARPALFTIGMHDHV